MGKPTRTPDTICLDPDKLALLKKLADQIGKPLSAIARSGRLPACETRITEGTQEEILEPQKRSPPALLTPARI